MRRHSWTELHLRKIPLPLVYLLHSFEPFLMVVVVVVAQSWAKLLLDNDVHDFVRSLVLLSSRPCPQPRRVSPSRRPPKVLQFRFFFLHSCAGLIAFSAFCARRRVPSIRAPPNATSGRRPVSLARQFVQIKQHSLLSFLSFTHQHTRLILVEIRTF